jgi:cell division protein FtsZ
MLRGRLLWFLCVQVNEVAAVISEIVADDANIIFGTSVDESFQDEISVTVVATSFGELW